MWTLCELVGVDWRRKGQLDTKLYRVRKPRHRTLHTETFMRNGLTPHIYILKCGNDYKIGLVVELNNLRRRIIDLQIGNPRTVELVCSFPGTYHDEQDLHILLKLYTVRGEWFTGPEVERVVKVGHEQGIAAALGQAQMEVHQYAGYSRTTRRECLRKYLERREKRNKATDKT